MFNTRKITYLATLTSVSVVIIAVLTSLTPLGAYPTTRAAFEGLLVKLTGYLFGPIFGIITALITEFLIILIRPGFIHWSYTLCIILYGLFGGLAYLIRKKSSNPVLMSSTINVIISSAFIAVAIALQFNAISFLDANSVVILTIHIPKVVVIALLVFVPTIIIFYSAFSLYFIYMRNAKITSSIRKIWHFFIKKQISEETNFRIKQLLIDTAPISFLCILTEILSIFLFSYGNTQILGSGNYSFWVMISLTETPIRYVLNIAIIYTGWKILAPLIQDSDRDYSRRISFQDTKFYSTSKWGQVFAKSSSTSRNNKMNKATSDKMKHIPHKKIKRGSRK